MQINVIETLSVPVALTSTGHVTGSVRKVWLNKADDDDDDTKL